VIESNSIVAGIDIEPNSDLETSNVSITGNTVLSAGELGISVSLANITTASKVGPITVTGNTVKTAGSIGIYLINAIGTVCNGNYVQGSVSDGIYADAASLGAIISANTVRDAGRYGIYNKGTDVLISGNMIYDSVNDAIRIYIDSANTSIIGNQIYNSGAQGIYSIATRTFISGNNVRGTTTAAVYLAGSGEIIGNFIFTDYNGNVVTVGKNGATVHFDFANNSVESTTALASNKGVRLEYAAVGKIMGNSFTGLSQGVSIGSAAKDDLIIHDNQYYSCSASIAFGYYATGTVTLSAVGKTLLDSTDGAVTATLPDGVEPGTIKVIKMYNSTNPSTVSVSHHATSDPEVFTFDAVTDILILMWNGLEWVTISNVGVTV
jgi:hypothetical protein